MRGAAEYQALANALLETRPVCADDPRYVAEQGDLTAADLVEMEARCDRCPNRALCWAYAVKGHPEGGYWAGRFWSKEGQ